MCFCFNLCVSILDYSFRLLSFQWTIDSGRAGCAEESEGVHGERSCPHYDRGLSIFVFVCLLWYYHCVTSSFFLWFLLINTGRRQSFLSISFQSLELWVLLVAPSRFFPVLCFLDFLWLCGWTEFHFFFFFKFGLTSQGYGCPGLSITANAIATAEISRVDASCGTFNLVHTSLGMLTIGKTS